MYFKIKSLITGVLLLTLLSGCSYSPQDIRFGEQECDHCRMIISDQRFAAQMVTDKGRHFSFDAIECLAAYVVRETYAPAEAYALWVPYFEDPDTWLEAETAHFLKSDELPSPMGLHFSAYQNAEESETFAENYGGETHDWESVKKIVDTEWFGE